MSRRARPQKPPRKASLHKREIVARRIGDTFNRLPPDKKREFTDKTLTALVNMSKKQMQKQFGKFFKKGRPSDKALEEANQLAVVFIYSVKPEFQPHYATMIYKAFNRPIPPDLPERLKQLRKLIFLSDMGVSPDVYHRFYELWEKMGCPKYDDFFNKLISNIELATPNPEAVKQ